MKKFNSSSDFNDINIDVDESIKWVMRSYLGRDPKSDSELLIHRAHKNFESLRKAFCQTSEFRAYFKSANGVVSDKYSAPVFLLPQTTMINEFNHRLHKQKFSIPTLDGITSQLCTYNQFNEDTYAFWCKEMAVTPAAHRKQWEFVWILQAMKSAGLLEKGGKALGFGTGKEPIPSILAKYGVFVMASDAPFDNNQIQGWDATNQYSQNVDDLFWPTIVDQGAFKAQVNWMPIDMNAIPADLANFDVCWSACAFEHLGSIHKGLDFVKNSLKVLKPGGFAIHTTEFNLSSNDKTIESEGLSIFRKCDIEQLADDLVIEGHDVWPINFHPGNTEIDEIIDTPPYSLPHLKLEVVNYSCTSIGLIIRKAV